MRSQPARTVIALVLAQASAATQSSWTLATTVGPPLRAQYAMAFDSVRGRTVMFGGADIFGPSYTVFGDTWEWDGNVWLQRLPQTQPAAREAPAMVFDSQRARTVLFGGLGASAPGNDTWEWDGAQWSQVGTAGPARYGHRMAYDSLRDRVVLFGGYYGGHLGDTWEWDGVAWINVASTGPSPRSLAGMAYDSVRQRTVLFGGTNPTGLLADTWEWDGASWAQRNAGPGPRHSPAMVFFHQLGRILLYGGYGSAGALGDTWEWNGSQWTQLPVGGPGPRAFHAMAYDSWRRRSVLWGGFGPYPSPGHTWEFSAPMATTFSTGCGTPPLVINPVAAAPPVLGTTAQAVLTNVPSPLAFVALGLSNAWFGATPLPLSLQAVGMPGCLLHHSAEVVGEPATATGPGSASYGFPIPNSAALLDLHLYLQAWAWAPGANPANAIVSNGLDWRLGY